MRCGHVVVMRAMDGTSENNYKCVLMRGIETDALDACRAGNAEGIRVQYAKISW